MSSIFQKFKLNLLEDSLVEADDKILLGVSGGSDSIALFELFLELRREFPINIYVAHINYHLRGNDSDLDEELVKEKCLNEGVKCFILNVNSEDFTKTYGTGIEEKARNIRYAYFSELKRKNGLSKIATAHTKDDLVETLLFNIIRGTSPEKFVSILPVYDEKSGILRPLLNFTKEELSFYNRSRNTKFRFDLSNEENFYSRNKLRNIIIPEIKKINPSFEDSLLKFRKILLKEEDFITKEVFSLFDGDNILRIENSFFILRSLFLNLEDAIRLRLIRKIRELLLGDLKDFYYSQTVYIKNGILKSANFKYSDKFIEVYINESWIIIKSKIGNCNYE